MNYMPNSIDFRPLYDGGEGEPILLLHGLFGNLSNWDHVIDEFTSTHRVIIPKLPFHAAPLSKERLDGLVAYIENFVDHHKLGTISLMGNSLGGHIALLYTIRNPYRVENLVLTGSSGLFENSFGSTFPRVRDYEFIYRKVEETFYQKQVVTKELVDEVYQTVQNPAHAISLIGLARAAQRHNVSELLYAVSTPTLLIWGEQDTITPPEVAEEFHALLHRSEIVILERCGHVPMMEQPVLFNKHVRAFLNR